MIKDIKKKKAPSSIQMLKKSPTAVAGIIIVTLVIVSAMFAPWISPYNPSDTDLYSRMKPPSAEHPFGTDKLGRDVFSRIIWGARVSLKVGVISVGIGMTIGVLLGLVAGYFGRMTGLAFFFGTITGLSFLCLCLGLGRITGFTILSRRNFLTLEETPLISSFMDR